MREDGNSKPLPQRPLLVPSFCRYKTRYESFFMYDKDAYIYALVITRVLIFLEDNRHDRKREYIRSLCTSLSAN